MAKMISNRMKSMLGGLISESQSAFIPDRLKMDNNLVAAEVGHFLNIKQCGLVGWGALKLDMAKAYDRMEWSFLRGMLLALAFAPWWVDLIMICVTSVSYNILVNGENGGQVLPTRGLRQDDLLSPYLFIICAEGLSLLLQQSQPVVTKHCLFVYEGFSGQAVNFQKSSVCFSRNTMESSREEVAQVLGVSRASNFEKYLGLPSFVGKNKKLVFSYIEDKFRQRVGSWNKKFLSQAGREILLRSVAQAMPTFSMSVFLLPDSLCLALESIMAAHDLVCGGIRRKIGDGTTTLIWGHPWLPNEPNPMVQTPMHRALHGSKVSGLINRTSGTWDMSILSDLFCAADVDRIARVPVSPSYMDSWY
ncbi:uncharacterized protein LOC116033173 [Ipomoea triloba]|uniref:uncharacterized protein LOC116033173 n=1 Tax=Ipomoea triloba TaxID=35885 RepID=UPI00125D1F87|nr:uncharacterized protein LOC116033173 [Ipomoea triloba]